MFNSTAYYNEFDPVAARVLAALMEVKDDNRRR